MKDRRKNLPHGFMRKNPAPKQLFEHVVHVASRVYSKSKKKWMNGYKSLRCGKRRQQVIEDTSLAALDVSQKTGIPVYEVIALRGLFGITPTEPPQREMTTEELKSDYVKRFESVYEESYSEMPLGARGHIHQESYLAQNKDDGRLLEVRYRNITQYGNEY